MMKQRKLGILAVILSVTLLSSALSGCSLIVLDTETEESIPEKPSQTAESTLEEESSPEETVEETEVVVTEEQLAIRTEFDEMLDAFLVKAVSQSGISIHDYMQHPEEYGITIEDYVLYSHDEEAVEAENDAVNQWLAEQIAQFDIEDLSWQQQIIYEKIQYENEMTKKYEDITTYDTMLSTNNGLISSLAIVLYEYRFLEEKDVQEYLLYLEDVPVCMEDLIAGAKESIEMGYAPSDNMLESSIDTLEDLCETEGNPLLEGFDAKVDEAEYLTEESKSAYKEKNKELVETVLMPSFRETIQVLQGWTGTLPELKGLSAYEGGAEYYDYLVEMYTGSGMTAEEMHTYLTDNMEQYLNAFYAMLYSNQDALMMYMEESYEFPYDDPAKVLEDLQAYTEEEFPAIEHPGVSVSYLPEAMEIEGTLAYYVTPQIDVDTINVIRLNGSALSESVGVTYSTLGHEGYPGHLYAYNYIKQSDWHEANNLFSYLGYGEGWAEYAGSISLNWWDLDEGLVKIMQLENAMGQILTGIVDTGVNALGWTIEDVEGCLVEYYGLEPGSDETVEAAQSYYDFVIDTPGIILSYSAGYLQVIDLRNTVRDVMGDDYTDRAFYEAYLNVGETPFYLTEKYVLQQVEGK